MPRDFSETVPDGAHGLPSVSFEVTRGLSQLSALTHAHCHLDAVVRRFLQVDIARGVFPAQRSISFLLAPVDGRVRGRLLQMSPNNGDPEPCR